MGHTLRRMATNIFCPTGAGGGVDPSCGSGGTGASQGAHGAIHDMPVMTGGTGKEGRHVTYHTTDRDTAQSYVEMYNDRFGSGGGVHDRKITISNPAPAHVVAQEAKRIGMDNESYTPASVFDNNLHADSHVAKLVQRLKDKGYDGTVLEDIPYGIDKTIQAYITFTGAKQPKAVATPVLPPGTTQQPPAPAPAPVKASPAPTAKAKAVPSFAGDPVKERMAKDLKRTRKDLKELEEAQRRGFLMDPSQPDSYRKRIADMEKHLNLNESLRVVMNMILPKDT